MTASECARALREVADWYDAHPALEAPANARLTVFAMDTKENAEAVARALSSCTKKFGDSVLTLSRNFNGIELAFLFVRDAVCERRVVGTKVVPRRVIPEQIVEEHEEDIVEWECGPVLGAESA